MSLEDRLQIRAEGLEAGRLIERRGMECLTFAELARPGLEPDANAHLETCDRCSTLRERLRQTAAAEPCESTAGARLDLGRPRRWLLLSPLASAACLALAVWIAIGRSGPAGPTAADDALRQRVLDGAAVVDSALRVLSDHTRDGIDENGLKAQNQVLRDELRVLIAHLEKLLQLAREPVGETHVSP